MIGRLATAEDHAWYAALPPDGQIRARWTPALLRLAHDRQVVGGAPGLDGMQPQHVTPELLEALRCRVLDGTYQPYGLLHLQLRRDGKVREIAVPTLADQLVAGALLLLMEPALERVLAPHVWGFRPGRSREQAVATLCGRGWPGDWTLVRADIRGMFPEIDHRTLLAAVQRHWPDPLALATVGRMMGRWMPGVGLPQGVCLSPLLANTCMVEQVDGLICRLSADGHDRAIFPGMRVDLRMILTAPAAAHASPAADRTLHAAIRYADDFALVASGDGRWVLPELERALAAIRMRLNPDKTRLHDPRRPAEWPATVLGLPVRPQRLREGIGLIGA